MLFNIIECVFERKNLFDQIIKSEISSLLLFSRRKAERWLWRAGLGREAAVIS